MKNWRTVLVHLTLWILFVTLALIVGASYLGFFYFFKKAVAFIGLAIALFYLNYSFLVQKFYLEKKYFVYFSITLLLALATSSIRYLFEENVVPEIDFVEQDRNELLIFMRYFASCICVIGWALVFRIVADWRKKERQLFEWQALKHETDLKFLKNQLRPHFLFNSINNIYSIAVENEDKSAPLLVEISKMLRYLIYKTDDDRILIKEEIDFLNSLIKLYSLSFEYVAFKEIEVKGDINKHQIPPLILLPFIENIFKHGDFEKPEDNWRLELKIQDGFVKFTSQNPIRVRDIDPEAGSGIGLSNLRKRLELLFPNSYLLQTKTMDNNYFVHLELKLDE